MHQNHLTTIAVLLPVPSSIFEKFHLESINMFNLNLPQISTRNEMRILNWGHIAQITMVLIVIILAFVKIGSGNVRGRSDVWGLSVVSPSPFRLIVVSG